MLKLYTAFSHKWNASNWYRAMLPYRTAARMGIADVLFDNYDLKIKNEEERRAAAALYSDIIQHYQNHAPMLPMAIKSSKEFPAYWQSKDMWNFAPHFVMDTDDDLFNVDPLNPAFKDLGIRVNGEKVCKGQSVTVEVPGKGRQTLWQDGVDGFDVEANHNKLDHYRKNLEAVDLVTCSTQGAADYVLRETGRFAHIYPNCIDFTDWPKIELAQDDKIRILWQSSSTHFGDIWPLVPALKRINDKYKNVEFIIFGSPYKWLLDALDPDRTTVITWMSYELYMVRLGTLNADINLAPLQPTLFNQTRSAIRLYEAAAIWKPAATLAERAGSYTAEIEDGVTGMLFSTPEEFEQKLEAMIEDRMLCRTMAANAKDWIRTNRDPRVHVPKLLEAYQALRDGRRAVMFPPTTENTEDVSEEQPDVREREGASSG